MLLSNEDARKLVFSGFAAFQEAFHAMIKAYVTATTAKDRAAIATRFVKESMIPYLDNAKDALLADYAPRIDAIEAELTKLLGVFGEAGT